MKKLFFLLLSLSTMALADTCSDLTIGQSRSIQISWQESLTTVPANYTLYRKSGKSFQIYFNLFFNSAIAEDYAENIRIMDQMKLRVKNCLARKSEELSKKLPYRLSLHLYDHEKDKDIESPPQVEIDIIKAGERAYSTGYREDISCFVILHETLHLTGLVDEYYETEGADNAARFSSRTYGPANSIMVQGNGAIFDIFRDYQLYPAHMRQIIWPNCEEKNKTYLTCSSKAYSSDGSKDPSCKDGKQWLQ